MRSASTRPTRKSRRRWDTAPDPARAIGLRWRPRRERSPAFQAAFQRPGMRQNTAAIATILQFPLSGIALATASSEGAIVQTRLPSIPAARDKSCDREVQVRKDADLPSIPARRDRSCDAETAAPTGCSPGTLNSRDAGYDRHTISPQFQLRWIRSGAVAYPPSLPHAG